MMVRSSKVEGEKPNDADYLEEKDWISNLPDGVLCHILSLMPTRNAVRTSILSTRWKYLWTSVPIINLHCWWRSGEVDGPSNSMDFVDRFLLLHNLPNLNKFLLNCGPRIDPYQFNSWVSTAIKRHVQELRLSICMESVVHLPCQLFTSIDLVVLELRCHWFYLCPLFHWSPSTVFLPRLKVLHLCSLGFLDDGSLKNILSGCPVLEELEILTSEKDKINTLYICSSTLKKLIIHNLFKERSVQCCVVIKAPNLESLKLSDSVSRDFEVDELPALVKAIFCVRFRGDNHESSDYYCNAVVRMLSKASNVQHLWFDDLTLEVVIRASAYNELSFHSLTYLNIGIYDTPWSAVPDLLGCFPSLTVLLLEKPRKFFGTNCCMCQWSTVPEIVPVCLSLSLEKIEFGGFYGCSKEMKLVRYLLENAMVLKKLTLGSWSRNKKIKTDLQKYKRGSSTCEIEFRYQKNRSSVVMHNSSVEWL